MVKPPKPLTAPKLKTETNELLDIRGEGPHVEIESFVKKLETELDGILSIKDEQSKSEKLNSFYSLFKIKIDRAYEEATKGGDKFSALELLVAKAAVERLMFEMIEGARFCKCD